MVSQDMIFVRIQIFFSISTLNAGIANHGLLLIFHNTFFYLEQLVHARDVLHKVLELHLEYVQRVLEHRAEVGLAVGDQVELLLNRGSEEVGRERGKNLKSSRAYYAGRLNMEKKKKLTECD